MAGAQTVNHLSTEKEKKRKKENVTSPLLDDVVHDESSA